MYQQHCKCYSMSDTYYWLQRRGHSQTHIRWNTSLSSLPLRPFCLTDAGLGALLSRHSWRALYTTNVIIIKKKITSKLIFLIIFILIFYFIPLYAVVSSRLFFVLRYFNKKKSRSWSQEATMTKLAIRPKYPALSAKYPALSVKKVEKTTSLLLRNLLAFRLFGDVFHRKPDDSCLQVFHSSNFHQQLDNHPKSLRRQRRLSA